MSDLQRIEVEKNYDFFQRNLADFLSEHSGQFALLRKGAVVDWFDGPGDAYRQGLAMFADGLFSIQEADERPAEI